MGDKSKGAVAKDNTGVVRPGQLYDHSLDRLGVPMISIIGGAHKPFWIELRQALSDFIGVIGKEFLRRGIGVDNDALGIGNHDLGITPIDGGADAGELSFFGLGFRQVDTGGHKTILVPTGSPF